MKKIKIIKIGGSILVDEIKRRRLFKKIIKARLENELIILVVSAWGRNNDVFSTDGLDKLGKGQLNAQEHDRLLSIGETLSVLLVTRDLRLEKQKVASLSLVELGFLTDGNFGNAFVSGLNNEHIVEYLHENNFVVAPGFLGISGNGEPTTLGRESSDLSAVLLASLMEVKSVTFFKEKGNVLFPFLDSKINCPWTTYPLLELMLLAKYDLSPLHKEALLEAKKEGMQLQIIGEDKKKCRIYDYVSKHYLAAIIKRDVFYTALSLYPCELKSMLEELFAKHQILSYDLEIFEDGVNIKMNKDDELKLFLVVQSEFIS